MLGTLKARLLSWTEIDIPYIVQKIADSNDIKEAIIYLNTEKQLYLGKDKLGQDLESIGGDYSPFTKDIKSALGQPIDRVTLRDTGTFYESFEVNSFANYIEITANPFKDGVDLQQRWGFNIIGLNEEHKTWLINEIKVRLIQEIKATILEY